MPPQATAPRCCASPICNRSASHRAGHNNGLILEVGVIGKSRPQQQLKLSLPGRVPAAVDACRPVRRREYGALREVTICSPILHAAAHPRAAAKAAIHHVVQAAKPKLVHAHLAVGRTIRRHAYLAPKLATHAKVVVVCTVIAAGGSLGAGAALGGDPPALPFISITQHAASAAPGDPVSVPEPSSLAMLASAGAALPFLARRRRGDGRASLPGAGARHAG